MLLCMFFHIICNLFFVTGKSFWISGQRFLTSYWTNICSLTSRKQRIYFRHRTSSKSLCMMKKLRYLGCFTESWLKDDMNNIQLAGFSVHQQYRTAASSKNRGGGLCLFVNNSWFAKSNIKEVSRFCSPEVDYLMISCRPRYLPRECSSIFLVYLQRQTDAGTKTALNELYEAISKQENAHPEAVRQVVGDINAAKFKSVLLHFYQHVTCATREKKL